MEFLGFVYPMVGTDVSSQGAGCLDQLPPCLPDPARESKAHLPSGVGQALCESHSVKWSLGVSTAELPPCFAFVAVGMLL